MKLLHKVLKYLTKPALAVSGAFIKHPWLMRRGFRLLMQNKPFAENVHLSTQKIGTMKAGWLGKSHAPEHESVLLYLHGGGYVIGDIKTHKGMLSQMVSHNGMPVLLPEYRLAPEHPYPAAVDDALAAYQWIMEHYSNKKIMLAGDSAGGGLALTLMLKIKSLGLKQPEKCALLSPWADLRLISQSMQERVNRDAIVKPKILKKWGMYYAGKEPLDNPNLSSVLADLSGLPPLLIHVGTEETLYDDSITIYNNAIRDGVKAELYIANKMPHVWHMYYDISGEAASDLRKVADYLGG